MMVRNALSEWFYFGKDVYEDRLERCKMLVFLEYGDHPLMSWDEQVQEFKKRIMESRLLKGEDIVFPWTYEPILEEDIVMYPMSG